MDGSGPRAGLSLDRLPATAKPAFFPCREVAAFLAEDKKAVSRRPPLCCGPGGCGPIAPRAKDRHRGCDGRGPTTEEDHHGYHRPKRTTTRRLITGSSPVPSNAALPGRRPRGTAT